MPEDDNATDEVATPVDDTAQVTPVVVPPSPVEKAVTAEEDEDDDDKDKASNEEPVEPTESSDPVPMQDGIVFHED